MHLSCSLENPLMEFTPLEHFGNYELLRISIALLIKNGMQGLATLLAFIAQKSLKPYFMLEMLMGFTSRSFIPVLKLKTLPGFVLPCGSFHASRLEAFFLNTSCT